MAFSGTSQNGFVVESDVVTGVNNATQYSSVFPKEAAPLPNTPAGTRFIIVGFNASAVTGTNLDIALFGSDTEAGTLKFLHYDVVVADITATGWAYAKIDLNVYPSPYYFIRIISDGDETSNTLTIKVIVQVA